MDDVLLKLRNRKERCRTWSPIAMTNHIRTLSLSLFQASISTSITLFSPGSSYTT
jgi:hypothetical protein